MSHSNLPRLQQPVFKNTLQKHEIGLMMGNYKRKLFEIQRSRSKFALNNTQNPQNINTTYRQLFQQNPKKNHMIQTKYLQIQRQNRLLFQKISNIHNQKGNKKQKSRSKQRMKSLNSTIRKKQVEEIQFANTKMFQRINKQKPSISFKDIDSQYLKTRKLSQKLSKIQKYKMQDWY